MTGTNIIQNGDCPAESLLKLLSGKWKPQIIRHALNGELRFNALLREIKGASKQSLSVALKELEEADVLQRTVISEKPLHVEYSLTEKGKAVIPVLQKLEGL